MTFSHKNQIRHFFGVATVCFILTIALSGPVKAADLYGAIAYNDNTGATGYSYDYRNRESAERRALSECRGNCSVKVWFKNACAALAEWRDQNGAYAYGYGWNRDLSSAQNKALSECRGRAKGTCYVKVWSCTTR